MFKIEVNVNGVTHGHYWMNNHEDDFLKFLPKQFTAQYGELITKDEITAYKIDEANFSIFEGKLKQHKNNSLDCDEGGAGVLRVCRKDKARLEADTHYPLEFFEKKKAEREEIFSSSQAPQAVTDLNIVQYDFGRVDENEVAIGPEDAVLVPAGHELTLEHCSVELEIMGEALSQWPYDDNGKFLGNN